MVPRQVNNRLIVNLKADAIASAFLLMFIYGDLELFRSETDDVINDLLVAKQHYQAVDSERNPR